MNQCSLLHTISQFFKFKWVFECVLHLGTVVAAVLDNPLHLFVNQLHTAQTGLLQALDLPLDEQLKGNFRHE